MEQAALIVSTGRGNPRLKDLYVRPITSGSRRIQVHIYLLIVTRSYEIAYRGDFPGNYDELITGDFRGTHKWSTLYHHQGRQGRHSLLQYKARLLPAFQEADDCSTSLPLEGENLGVWLITDYWVCLFYSIR